MWVEGVGITKTVMHSVSVGPTADTVSVTLWGVR